MPERDAPATLDSLSTTVPGATPDLLRWLDQQLQAGLGHAALLQSLRDTGWADAVARQALESVVRWRTAPTQTSAPTAPLPGPDLARTAGVSFGVVKGLLDEGVLEGFEVEAVAAFDAPDPNHAPATLNPDQAASAAAIAEAVTAGGFALSADRATLKVGGATGDQRLRQLRDLRSVHPIVVGALVASGGGRRG